MKIKCVYKEILAIDDPRLIPNPDNPNDHSEQQIEQFARILKYQGQRKPIIVSNQSGFIVTGHGTLMAAKKAGAESIAVDFQDFDSPAQEYAHVVADNGMAMQSELDKAKINSKLPDFGPELEIEMLGLDDFKVDFSEVELPDLGDGSDPDFQQRTFILSNEQNDLLNEAMDKAKGAEDCSDEINKNPNGNVLAAILKRYVHG